TIDDFSNGNNARVLIGREPRRSDHFGKLAVDESSQKIELKSAIARLDISLCKKQIVPVARADVRNAARVAQNLYRLMNARSGDRARCLRDRAHTERNICCVCGNCNHDDGCNGGSDNRDPAHQHSTKMSSPSTEIGNVISGITAGSVSASPVSTSNVAP